jgi:hypothetical protein
MEVPMADMPTSERAAADRRGQAMPGGRFPVKNRGDLENAIRAVGRAKGGEQGRQAVRRFILKRAKALNLTSLIPETWASDGSLKS